MTAGLSIQVEIAAGDLIDKIVILEIKSERMRDPHKLEHVQAELASLAAVRDAAIEPSPELGALSRQLREVNAKLWQIEDDIRACERTQDFGARFVALARAVYRENDQRAALKRRINELLGSRLIEEKSYPPYR